MNRTDRLLAIVLQLQGRGRMRAEDLAAIYETSVRTIYRDMQALCEAGVPVVSTPGRGYELVEGYFLPPLQFTDAEAGALLLGTEWVAGAFDVGYAASAREARLKIEAVLPPRVRADVDAARQVVRLIPGPGGPGGLGRGADKGRSSPLEQLRGAVAARRRVRFRYHTRHTHEDGAAPASEPAAREVDPYGLAHYNGAWYLVGYCHLRGGARNFRLDRIERLAVLDIHFTPPPGPVWADRDSERGREITVRVLFDRAVARWVREAASFYVVAYEDASEGLLATLRVRHERDALGWLLGWGRAARVLEPESLRRLLAEEAKAVFLHYQDPATIKTPPRF